MSDPSQIGIRIRDVRREKGWTQDQLAVAIGVSRSAVAQWETGRAGQVTGNLTRIAATLEVGVEYLMHGETSGVRPKRALVTNWRCFGSIGSVRPRTGNYCCGQHDVCPCRRTKA